jgi:ABC-type dipeptide/oligopeptide/nickel transport system permease component
MSMTRYVIRRLLGMAFVVFMILTISFVLAYLIPAEPARAVAGPKASQKTIDLIRKELGLDQPLYTQYFRYLSRVLQGDLGESYVKRQPVSELILNRLPFTAALALAGVVIELVLGIPIGILSAVRQRSILDRSFMLLALFGVSAPSFWLGLVLLYLFAFRIPIFPLGGPGGLSHLILPALTLGIAGAAWYARMLRSSMLDILSADFVRTARAKGLHERAVLLSHVMRNAVQPIVTMAGMDLGYYLGGIVLIEVVFSWPGIGWEMWTAVKNLDIPVIIGTITFSAVAIVVMNLLVDLLYSVIDPRVRLS